MSTNGLIAMPDLTNEVCKALYDDLYSNIKTNQDGDASISLDTRMQNMAYNLASPICRAIISGVGGEAVEVPINNLVQKSGDSMTGQLNMLYGFQAGVDGSVLVRSVFSNNDKYLSVTGKIKIESSKFYLDNKLIFKRVSDAEIETLEIDGGQKISFLESDLITKGSLLIGESQNNGFYVTSSSLKYLNKDIYHAGNSNQPTIDWSMKNANVNGNLSVSEITTLNGSLSALYGVDLGVGGERIISLSSGKMEVAGDLSIARQFGYKINGVDVLKANGYNVHLTAIGGAVILGGGATSDIQLASSITTEGGNYRLIDKLGNVKFLNTFQVAYGYGSVLMSSASESIVIHDKLKFGDASGPYFKRSNSGISLSANFTRQTNESVLHSSSMYYGKTTSIYADLNKSSESLFINTTADFITCNKPIEASEFIGITESATRLFDNTLFFSDNNYLLNITDGIKHFGNSYFAGNLFSERFSTGLAGEGFGIRKVVETGDYEITSDVIVARKKIKAYEFEVQKTSCVNGSLWVSSTCSGDLIEPI